MIDKYQSFLTGIISSGVFIKECEPITPMTFRFITLEDILRKLFLKIEALIIII